MIFGDKITVTSYCFSVTKLPTYRKQTENNEGNVADYSSRDQPFIQLNEQSRLRATPIVFADSLF